LSEVLRQSAITDLPAAECVNREWRTATTLLFHSCNGNATLRMCRARAAQMLRHRSRANLTVSEQALLTDDTDDDPTAANEMMMRAQAIDVLRRRLIDERPEERCQLLMRSLIQRLGKYEIHARNYADVLLQMSELLSVDADEVDRLSAGISVGCRLSDLACVHKCCILPALQIALRPLNASSTPASDIPLTVIASVAMEVALVLARLAPLLLLHLEHLSQCTMRPGATDNPLNILRSKAQSLRERSTTSLSSSPLRAFIEAHGSEQLIALYLKTAVLPRWNLHLRDILQLLALAEHASRDSKAGTGDDGWLVICHALGHVQRASRVLEAVYLHLNSELRTCTGGGGTCSERSAASFTSTWVMPWTSWLFSGLFCWLFSWLGLYANE